MSWDNLNELHMWKEVIKKCTYAYSIYNELEMPRENSHQLAVIKLLYMYAYNICT